MSTFPCEGCGKRLNDEPYHSEPYSTTNVAGRDVYLCGGGRSYKGVKRECLLKALTKLSLCPGCGEEVHHWPIETICDGCKRDLDMASKVKENKTEIPVHRKLPSWYSIARSSSDEDAEHREAEKPIKEFLAVLARILSPKSHVNDYGDATVEIKTSQVEALGELPKAIEGLWRAAHEVGRRRGKNLLLGLATGEVSVEEFSERDVARARERQG